MPGFDGTGPMGQGPMTGGGRGYCSPAAGYVPRYGMGFGYGRGMGRGRAWGGGFGRGYGRGFGPRAYASPPGAVPPAYGYNYAMDPGQELNMLRSEADGMKQALDDIHQRINELEKERSES